MAIPWICDSGAYFIGSKFGKSKMAPRISPNKSWEGTIGGFVTSIIGGALFNLLLMDGNAILFSMLVAGVASSAGQAGDLVESLLKRAADVKDSGKIFPGHGGMLDRIDSLLYSAIVVYISLKI